jgi:hypothetical protein
MRLSPGVETSDLRRVSSPDSGFANARRGLLARIGLIVVAIGIGLLLQQWLRAYLAALDDRSRTDLLGARAELARVFQALAVVVFGTTGLVGVSVVQACRRAARELVFPPSGLRAWRAARTVTGPRALQMARIGMGLGVVLIAASAAGAGLSWYMAAVLRACRAGLAH